MNKWFSSLLSLLAITGLHAQQTVETPKLVVSIVVDQLRGDYLQYFASTFGEKGFKRLMNGGLVYHSVDFNFPNLSEASSIASIYTGTYPYYNGITGDYKYDIDKNREISIVADDNYMGNYTSDRLSPLTLLATTVSDELKIASQGQSLVYAVAPDAVEAIISGGRYANGAFWLDDYNGKWATSTYYKDAPWYVERYNSSEAIGNFPEKQWNQSYSYYAGLPYSTRLNPFSYNFTKNDKDRFLKIKQTSLINTEVTNLAGRIIENAGFGSRSASDFISISYYAGNYKLGSDPEEYSYEIQDIYYRLDKELEKLLDLLERKVGLKHTLILLTSTGYYDSLNKLPQGFKPMGEFYPNRCTALLNMYLMAIYGQGNWVSGYYNQQIYLNKKLAEEKQVKWNDLVRSAAEFTAQFSGVQEVTTAGQWMVDDTGRAAAFRRGMNKKLSGDVFIELQPGWVVVNENNPGKPEYIRDNAILSPLFIFGEYVKKEHIYRKVKATEIAPTMSFVLRIRPPNGCKDLPLQEIIR
ncbi:alkaline phosphatase [Bacteroidia bacterium]|nr:alkaline phosphatase [Bacteroidia bacterium]GHT02379.1 alkaline phosphatase [Bacteroidia bacterium]GHT49203.1 alkaline phosphatase [Bacteroidia bacterium]